MLKCQKEEKGFCKTQKYELQFLPAACCFQKNELELFLEDWPRRPPSSPDASGLPHFPSTLLQPSTPPISHFFFFFFLPPFFFFSFFSFFFPLFLFFLLFIIFSLHFLFSRLFLSSFLFPFLLYVFLSNLFFLPFFSFSFFYHITLHVFLCAPSQRLQNRTQFCKPVQGHLPLAGFRGGAPYSFLFFLYV